MSMEKLRSMYLLQVIVDPCYMNFLRSARLLSRTKLYSMNSKCTHHSL